MSDFEGNETLDSSVLGHCECVEEKRCQCRFWKTVENYQPGFQYLGDSWKDPQKSGSQKTDADDKQKTDQCLI